MFYSRSTRICIIWGGKPEYWEWLSHLSSRFYIFALPLILKEINLSNIIKEEKWLNLIESVGLISEEKIRTRMLSKRTSLYFAYLVFKWEDSYRVKAVPFSRLGPRARLPLKRGSEGNVEERLIEFRNFSWKHAFIVQGIEFRP
uniref:Uncharacterized protein n=1 Tax=Solanum lycopersicum TaxID=4081 RepID=A0A3Q7G5E2_SOLLC